jgi:transketolase
MAALSKHPSIFVFTHDSIGLGEDGPTHQPVEQLASLRAIPGLLVIRPADANETAASWKFIFEYRDGPVALLLTRQGIPVLEQDKYASAANLVKGTYVLIGADNPEVLLLASGSEVSIAIEAYEKLLADGISARVVSMPCWELFEKQQQQYQNSVIPAGVKARVGIEAGIEQGWRKWLGDKGVFIGMSSFGASAPEKVCFEKFGITVEKTVETAKNLISSIM